MGRVEGGGPDEQPLGLPQVGVQPLELLPADVLGARVGPDLPADFDLAGPEQRQGEYVVGGGGDEFPQGVFDAGHIGDHADEERPVGALRQPVDVLPDPRPVPSGGGLSQPAGLGEGGGELEVGGWEGCVGGHGADAKWRVGDGFRPGEGNLWEHNAQTVHTGVDLTLR